MCLSDFSTSWTSSYEQKKKPTGRKYLLSVWKQTADSETFSISHIKDMTVVYCSIHHSSARLPLPESRALWFSGWRDLIWKQSVTAEDCGCCEMQQQQKTHHFDKLKICSCLQLPERKRSCLLQTSDNSSVSVETKAAERLLCLMKLLHLSFICRWVLACVLHVVSSPPLRPA